MQKRKLGNPMVKTISFADYFGYIHFVQHRKPILITR